MSLEKIIKILEDIFDLLKSENLKPPVQETKIPEAIPEKPPVQETKTPEAVPEKPSDFAELKALLESPKWPQAAPDFLICEETEKDKMERAEGIVSYLGQEFKEQKFLDFGCGEGHVVKHVSGLGAAKSTGYDIKTSGPFAWNQEEGNSMLTTDFEYLKSNAPYDYVLIYDVLDHAENPVALLKMVSGLINEKSKIFVRCHPWSARHSTHQYRKLNKAYIQLVFTEDEIKSLGLQNDIVQKTHFPVNENNKWFAEAGLDVVTHDQVKTEIEEFFKKTKLVADRIRKEPYDKNFPDHQMQQVFNDYVLKNKK